MECCITGSLLANNESNIGNNGEVILIVGGNLGEKYKFFFCEVEYVPSCLKMKEFYR